MKTRGRPPGSAQLGHPTPRHKITGLHEAGLESRATTSWSWPDLVVTTSPQASPMQPPGASQSTAQALERAGSCPAHQLLVATQEQRAQPSCMISVSMLSPPLHRVALGAPEAPGLSRKDCDSPLLVLDPVSPTSFRPTERQ